MFGEFKNVPDVLSFGIVTPLHFECRGLRGRVVTGYRACAKKQRHSVRS